MKGFFAMFVLTPREQRLIIFALLGLLAWGWLKDQRNLNVEASPPASSATPNER